MRAHVIENGRVVNTIVVDTLDEPRTEALAGLELVDADLGGAIGDSYAAGVFTPTAAVVVVPSAVTRRKGMAVLIKRGLLTQIRGVLNGIAGVDGELARNDFETSQTFERNWPLIAALQPVLSWSDAFVDDLFVEADTL